MFDRFTDDAKNACKKARQEAERLRHDHSSCAHMVLALFRDPDPQVATLCEQLEIDRQAIIDSIEARMVPGPVRQTHVQLPFAAEAKSAFEATFCTASNLGDSWIRPFHLLLGLLDNGNGEEAEALSRLGVDPDQIVDAIFSVVTPNSPEVKFLREKLLFWVKAVETKGSYRHEVLEDSGQSLIILLIATDARWLLEVRGSDFARLQVFDLKRTTEGEGVWSELDELFGGIPDSE